MKLNNNFFVSVVSANIPTEAVDSLSVAVSVSRLNMAVASLNAKASSLSKKIGRLEKLEAPTRKDTLALESARLELADVRAESAKYAEQAEAGKSVYESVVDSITAEGNERENVVRVLNAIALDNNRSLAPFAFDATEDDVTTEENSVKSSIMTALKGIVEKTSFNADGAPILNKENRAEYKSALNHLRLVVKNAFSLKADSVYLKRTMITPTAEELGLLVQTFVKDFEPVRVKSESGSVKVEYSKTLRDWSGVRTQIVKIVLKNIMRAV